MKTKKQRKRTAKEFVEYNDYRDRPFGLKWGTAFAIDELNKVIVDNKKNDRKTVERLPYMNRHEIDDVLQHAFLKSQKVSIQLHEEDENGNLLDSICGRFKGFADTDYLYLEDHSIQWDMIRNIKIIE